MKRGAHVLSIVQRILKKEYHINHNNRIEIEWNNSRLLQFSQNSQENSTLWVCLYRLPTQGLHSVWQTPNRSPNTKCSPAMYISMDNYLFASKLWNLSRCKRHHCTWWAHVTAKLGAVLRPGVLCLVALYGLQRRGERQTAKESKGNITERLHLGTKNT